MTEKFLGWTFLEWTLLGRDPLRVGPSQGGTFSGRDPLREGPSWGGTLSWRTRNLLVPGIKNHIIAIHSNILF